MSIHVAILKRPFVRMILAGQKTVESRLRKTRGEPFGSVAVGERLFLKASGGPFLATAVAAAVDEYADLDPAGVMGLCDRWDGEVCGGRAYWEAKKEVKFATLIRLGEVEPLPVGPSFRVQNMRAWYVLDESASPLREVTLSDGALRNGYLTLPADAARMRLGPFRLVLPNGVEVGTEAYEGRVRWRGWPRFYEAHDMQAGDTVRLTSLGNRRYAVGFRRRRA